MEREKTSANRIDESLGSWRLLDFSPVRMAEFGRFSHSFERDANVEMYWHTRSRARLRCEVMANSSGQSEHPSLSLE